MSARVLIAGCVCLFAVPALADDTVVQGRRVSEWVEILRKDPSARKRQAAVVVLSLHNVADPAVLPVARKALREDASPAVRLRLVAAFAGLAGPDAGKVAGDLAVACADGEPTVRAAALAAVGRVPDGAGVAVPAAVARLGDPVPGVRAAAVECLARFPADAKAHVPALAKCAGDADAAVRAAAVAALGNLAGDAAASVPALSARLSNDSDAAVRVEAARALGRFGADAAPATAALSGALRDASPDVRRAALLALADTGPAASAALPGVLKTLSGDGDPAARAYAVRTAARVAGPAVPEVVAALGAAATGDASGDVRLAAVDQLRALGPAARPARAALEAAGRDPSRAVRDAAAAALRVIDGR